MNRVPLFFLALLIPGLYLRSSCIAQLPPPAGSSEPKVNKRLYPRSVSEIKAAAIRIRASAKAQKGFTEEEQEALAELNIYRYLSGVPEVTLDRTCCSIAVKASEGCAKAGELSHTAVEEGKSCNLQQGQSEFKEIVHGCVEDPGDHNRERRGHRMWCLHPALGKTGFGRDSSKEYSGMWVSEGGMLRGKTPGRPLEFHAYPGNGFYPVSRLRGDGWSVYAGTPLPPGEPELKVYLLSARPVLPLSSATIPKDAKEIKIAFQKRNGEAGGWTNGWVVFEPEVKPEAGQIFWVSLHAGKVRIGYVVEFIGDEL